jgi:hypothetical protein
MRIVVVSIAGIFGMSDAVSGVTVVTVVIAGSAGFGRCRGKPEHLRERGRPVREEHSRERRRRCTEERREERKPCNRSKPNHFLLFILTRERRVVPRTPDLWTHPEISGGVCGIATSALQDTLPHRRADTATWAALSAQRPAKPRVGGASSPTPFSRTLPLPRRRSTRSAHRNGPPHSRQRP